MQNASGCEVHKLRRFDLNMARLGGFEPPTARFVAEYSIQLSYECIVGRIIGIETWLSNAFFLLIQKLTSNKSCQKP